MGTVVFLGDSLTQHGKWQDWFPDQRVRNRGVSGDTTLDVLERLQKSLGRAPRAVFLLVGTNDLGFGRAVPEVAANVTRIVSGIRNRAPAAATFVQSVMPRGVDFADRIRALNGEYQRIAVEHDATYLDLWPALGADDRLRAAFTTDGLHLTDAGYAAWVDVLRPFVERPSR